MQYSQHEIKRFFQRLTYILIAVSIMFFAPKSKSKEIYPVSEIVQTTVQPAIAGNYSFSRVFPTKQMLNYMQDTREWTVAENALPVAEKLFGASDVVYQNNVSVMNETKYDINVSELLNQDTPLLTDNSGRPQILIIHTHGSESYFPRKFDSYSKSFIERDINTANNVIRIGDELAVRLEELGLTVIHDRALYDYPSIIDSYDRSLEKIEKYKKKYPTIQIVIDLHRDAVVSSDGTLYSAVCDTNQGQAAQMLFVIGSNATELYHPDWRKNLSYAAELQNEISKDYPTIMRSIHLRKERFNQHVTPASFILEVGTCANTLDQAINAIDIFSKTAGSKIAQEILNR